MPNGDWDNVGEDGARYGLSVKEHHVEIRRRQNGETSKKNIPLGDLKQVRFTSQDTALHFRGPGTISIVPTVYECASEEERQEILDYLSGRISKTPNKQTKQNGFANNAVAAGMIIGVAALIFNAVLIGALLGSNPPSSGAGGSKGGRIIRGIQGLAHGMGWTGIVIMNVIFVVLWLVFTILEARKEYVIHTLRWQ